MSFSDNYAYCKADQLESFTYKSPPQDQDRMRRLPYKLLSFPSSKSNLWDHETVGDVQLLHLFYQRHLRVNIEKAVLRSGHIYLSPESKNATQMCCTLCGRLLITKDDKQVNIIFTKLKINEDITRTQTLQQNPIEYHAPVTFSVSAHAPNFHQHFKEQAVLWLQNSIRKKDAVVLNNFIRCKAQCQFINHGYSISCNIRFCLATSNAKFILKPISPITFIHTPLSRGLSDPKGNVFLHGESKSGYVTMNEARKVLLVLDSDPKVTSLPIFGIWISGVDTVQHPFVWASCIRYLNMESFGQQICVPPEPFLVLVYKKSTFRPQFYDCILDSQLSKDSFAIYSGSCDSVLDQADVGKLFEVRGTQPSNNDQLSFTLELMDESITASRKTSPSCLESTRRKNCSLEGSSRLDKGLSPSCKCSCKSSESFGKPDSGTSTPDLSNLSKTSQQERQGMAIPLTDSSIPNQKIYGRLLAQEQQIKQMQELINSLVHGKKAATLSVGCSSMDDGKPLVSKVETMPKTVSSAATMTSLAWPPPPVVSDCSEVMHVAIDDKKFPEDLPSPEMVRRQALLSPKHALNQSTIMNSTMGSLDNLEWPVFEESLESGQSSLVVDLHDYPESHASESSWESCSFAESRSHQEPASDSDVKDQSIWFGNLLRHVDNILSHQELYDGNVTGSNTLDTTDSTRTPVTLSNERPCFDSLLIPHLNYVSMMPTDLSPDQSLEFCTVALKYLNKCSTKLPPSASGRLFDRNNMTSLLSLYKGAGNNLSFATRQYLDKHCLNSTERKNNFKTD